MPQAFVTTRTLRFGDCDISGTAYFPAYFDMLNGVNEEFFAHIGLAWHEVIPRDRWATPTVHLSSDFARPSTFGDVLTFTLTLREIGRTSVTLAHRITCAEQRRWSATQVLAALDLDKRHAIPWPAGVRAVLQDWLVPDASDGAD